MIDEDEVLTIFRKFRDGGDIIALFPEIDEGPGICQSYMHVGQHSGADYGLLVRGTGSQWESPTLPASPTEYANLKAELERIGYKLRVRRRYQPNRR